MSRRNWLVTLLVALVAVVAIPTRGVLAQEHRPGKIAGLVLNAADEKPVAGAAVRVFGPRGLIAARTFSQRDGRFVVGPLRPGHYLVVAAKREVGRGEARVEVKEGEVTRAVIKLARK